MLSVAAHPEWGPLDARAPVSPRLLLAPHPADRPIRCYDARVHAGGLRVTLGVFETPGGAPAVEFVMKRLLLDASQLESAGTRPIAAGRLEGIARTGWIRHADDEAPSIANINWYFPEQTTARVHFVSTFVDVDQGQAASALVHRLLRSLTFVEDSARELDTVAL